MGLPSQQNPGAIFQEKGKTSQPSDQKQGLLSMTWNERPRRWFGDHLWPLPNSLAWRRQPLYLTLPLVFIFFLHVHPLHIRCPSLWKSFCPTPELLAHPSLPSMSSKPPTSIPPSPWFLSPPIPMTLVHFVCHLCPIPLKCSYYSICPQHPHSTVAIPQTLQSLTLSPVRFISHMPVSSLSPFLTHYPPYPPASIMSHPTSQEANTLNIPFTPVTPLPLLYSLNLHRCYGLWVFYPNFPLVLLCQLTPQIHYPLHSIFPLTQAVSLFLTYTLRSCRHLAPVTSNYLLPVVGWIVCLK